MLKTVKILSKFYGHTTNALVPPDSFHANFIALARVVRQKNSATSAGPLLNSLHWLPVHSRINFKIVTITYKSLHSQSPGYLASMLHHYIPTRNLRSSNSLLLSPHPAKTNFGLHAFQSAAPNIWNKLPNWCQVCMFHVIFQSSP